ncbi:MAG TPA: glycosyltransferase family A protein [Flavipsychrobacter sp.]|nr:glycosyltransferase family A protein [Flavipsychrobacter sp.]
MKRIAKSLGTEYIDKKIVLNNSPLVSIGVVCFNTGKYVLKTLESVLIQTYSNIEVIIVDDGSSDNSVELIEDWLHKNNKQHWQFIKHLQNKGLHYGLNQILDAATGKYITFIGDDEFVPEKTAKQVEMLEQAGPEYGVAYGNMSYIDEDSNPKGDSNWFDDKFCKNYAIPQGNVFHDVVYSVTFFIQASLYRLDLLRRLNFRFDARFITEDWYLNLVVSRYSKATGVYDNLCRYRYRNDSITATNWTDERMHKVLLSQLAMFNHVYSYPENNTEDKLVVYKKMHVLALQLYASDKVGKVTKAKVAFDLFRKQSSIKNLLKAVVLFVFGNLNLADNKVLVKKDR